MSVVPRCIVLELDGNKVSGGYASEATPRFKNVPLNLTVSRIGGLSESLRYLFAVVLQIRPKDFTMLIVEDILLHVTVRDALFQILTKEFQVAKFATKMIVPGLIMSVQ